jgi:6-pyruvoyltetrahydropterin/6-carboxytetrahydropterin synthase
MYRIGKKFTFDASHQLMGLPEGHQCGRLHGHTYTVEVTFVGEESSEEGWLFDFGALDPFKGWLRRTFDHRHLNDVLGQPTSENLAKYIFITVDTQVAYPNNVYLEKVRVSETPSTYAEYFGV